MKSILSDKRVYGAIIELILKLKELGIDNEITEELHKEVNNLIQVGIDIGNEQIISKVFNEAKENIEPIGKLKCRLCGNNTSLDSPENEIRLWIKYADTPTSGMSYYPDGKQFIGLTPLPMKDEPENYDDYNWYEIKNANKQAMNRVTKNPDCIQLGGHEISRTEGNNTRITKENTTATNSDVKDYIANFKIVTPMVNEIVTLTVRYSNSVAGSLSLLESAKKIILQNSETIKET